METLENEQVDILIVAGDIFDILSPPNYSLKLFYDFLSNLNNLSCLKKTVIVAGNHDSISFLETSKELLTNINILTATLKGENFLIPDYAVISAVPFLRDTIIREFVSGETVSKKEQKIQEGIINHYHSIYQNAKELSQDLPIIATGHLTITSTPLGEEERKLYIGNLASIDFEIFPKFDYIALGHIHKFYKVSSNIFYSGSPIPIGFDEAKYSKKIILWEDGKVKTLKIPIFRYLKEFHLDIDEVENNLEKVPENSFIKLDLKNQYNEALSKKIDEIATRYNLHIIKKSFQVENVILEKKQFQSRNLKELTPLEVFKKVIKNRDDKDELLKLFQSILLLNKE